MPSWLHEQRLEAVEAVIRSRNATTLLDLGCGRGELLRRVAGKQDLHRIVAVDIDAGALSELRRWLALRSPDTCPCDVEVVQASMLTLPARYRAHDCAVMVETLEHLEAGQLGQLETALFRHLRPATIVITTPNAEYNPLLGVPANRMRHPGHRFEWDRGRFKAWANGVAARNAYSVTCSDIAGAHPEFGGASQMAVFDLAPDNSAPAP
ncbi:class I SAM-dependent methyltransferase [Devosia sp. CAU 1758]